MGGELSTTMPVTHTEPNASTAKSYLDGEVAAYGKGMKAWYNEVYLQSEHWKCLRLERIKHDGGECVNCRRTDTLQVHHLRYRNIFDVGLDDLRTLCHPCHHQEHFGRAPIEQRRAERAPRRCETSPSRSELEWETAEIRRRMALNEEEWRLEQWAMQRDSDLQKLRNLKRTRNLNSRKVRIRYKVQIRMEDLSHRIDSHEGPEICAKLTRWRRWIQIAYRHNGPKKWLEMCERPRLESLQQFFNQPEAREGVIIHHDFRSQPEPIVA
jgi:hypothetical protein